MDVHFLYFLKFTSEEKKNVFKLLTFLNNIITIKCIFFLNDIFELQSFLIFLLILCNLLKKNTINFEIIVEDR